MSYNILVVDDSLPMRSIIIKTIKASGFKTSNFFEAGNGAEALEILKNQWLDLVITDYNMPGMNGMELIREMKKDSIFNSIPVLVVSTEGSRQKMKEFQEKGVADYIRKPFVPEEIKLKITQILGEVEDEECFEESDDDLDF
ncbi:MAG TPA: response regulator [Bacteroidetes bacterium]|nr:response regulator [Bacteroidota bacterium]